VDAPTITAAPVTEAPATPAAIVSACLREIPGSAVMIFILL
jgi:hypothetical protein